ncbi:MAG: PPC domain-containing protein [Chloroflexi bacterium]|nr:PPC domain-containing protein [Chloroflexota bacterium]
MLSLRLSRLIVTALVVALVAAFVPMLHHADAAGGGVIAYGEAGTGQITNKTYFELWQFDGQKGDRVQILMEGDGSLDPYMGLLDGASEEVLAEDDDSGGNSNAYIETTLTTTGTFIIVATRYGFDTGTTQGAYNLGLVGSGGPQNVNTTTTTAAGQPEELSPGVFLMGELPMATEVAGTIDNSAYAQIYTMQLEAGTDLVVGMFASNSTLDAYIIFANEAGDVLAEDNNSGLDVGGSKTDAFLRLTIPESGLYLVAATRAGVDTGKSTGEYVVIAGIPEEEGTPEQPTQPESDMPAGVESMGDLAVGVEASGSISDQSFVHLYAFEGQAGDQVTITMTGDAGLDAYLGLIDPNEEVVAEDDDSGGGMNAQISIRLPESGFYVIVATRNGIDQGDTAGSYTLVVNDGTPEAPTGASGIGGFGGLPGRSFEFEDSTFFLRGFGRSSSPDKNTPLEAFFQGDQSEQLPGRSFELGNNESFYLSGFGKSEDPTKATPLQSYLSGYLGQ